MLIPVINSISVTSARHDDRFWRVPLAEAVKYQILVMFLLKNGTPQVLSA